MKVDVQGVGLVEFPDDATQDEIAKTVNREFVQKPALKAGLEAGVKLPGQVSHILDLGALAGDFGRRESAKARLAQEMEQARTQTVGSELQSKFFGGAEKAVGALSQMNPLNVFKRTLELPTQIEQATGLLPPNAPSPTAPLISPETARKAIDFLDPHSYDEPGSAREGVKQFLAETASGLTSPDQAAAIVAGAKEPELVGRLFQIGAASQIPEAAQSLKDAIQTGDREAIGKSAAALAASTAIPVAIEKGLTRAKAKTGIKPTEEAPEPTPEVKPVAEPPPTPPKGEPEPQVAPEAQTPPTVASGEAPSTAPVKGTAEVGVQAPTEPAKVEGSATTPVTQVGESPQPLKWEKAPSVTPGGKQFFWVAHTDRGVAKVVWDRVDKKWVASDASGKEVGKFDSAEEGKTALEAPPQQPIGMGAAVQSEFDQPGSYVSNMFAAIDRDRVEMGKPPMEAGKKRTWDEDNQRALAKMNRDPQWG